MGEFRKFRHKRYRSHGKAHVEQVTVTANARAENPLMLARGDRVTIYFDSDTHNAYVSLDSDEIDCLIYELSRLSRFYNKELQAKPQ